MLRIVQAIIKKCKLDRHRVILEKNVFQISLSFDHLPHGCYNVVYHCITKLQHNKLEAKAMAFTI